MGGTTQLVSGAGGGWVAGPGGGAGTAPGGGPDQRPQSTSVCSVTYHVKSK